MEEIKYPQEFFRGISTPDFICNGVVIAAAFQFDKEEREDGYRELSINWNDDEHSIEVLFNQRKDNGKIQFKVGAAKMDFAFTKFVLKAHIDSRVFAYERREVEGNCYHGNLLLKANAPKSIQQLVTNGLALVAQNNIINNPNIE